MKKLIVLLLCTYTLFAGPQIVVDQAIKDFGIMEEGQTVFKHTYKITNIGDDTLRIQKVKPGCSCTIVDFPRTIAPGSSGAISSSLKVKKSGSYNKSIKVFSNSESNPNLTLRLKVEILSIINTSHRYLMLQENEPGIYKSSIDISTKVNPFEITDLFYQKRGEDSTKREVNYSITELPSMKESYYKKWIKQLSKYIEVKNDILKSVFNDPNREFPNALKYYVKEIENKKSTLDSYDELKVQELIKSKKELLTKFSKGKKINPDFYDRSCEYHLQQLHKDFSLGYKKYRLDFTLMVKLKFSEPGTFFMSTNVPEKKQLKVPCILEPSRPQ